MADGWQLVPWEMRAVKEHYCLCAWGLMNSSFRARYQGKTGIKQSGTGQQAKEIIQKTKRLSPVSSIFKEQGASRQSSGRNDRVGCRR